MMSFSFGFMYITRCRVVAEQSEMLMQWPEER